MFIHISNRTETCHTTLSCDLFGVIPPIDPTNRRERERERERESVCEREIEREREKEGERERQRQRLRECVR